jgi:hypothetical protein
MTRILSILLASVVLAAGTAAAQDKPNFAGTWKLTDPAQPEQYMATQIVVSQDTSMLTVVMTSQMGDIKTTYNLDGSVRRDPLDLNGQTIDRVTKATWNGSKLTLSTTSETNGQTVEFKRVLSAGPDGTLVLEFTFPDFQNGGALITQKAVYKKS